MLRGRLAPYLLSYANIEKVDSSPSSTNTRFERFVSLCAIYALLNVGYVKRCTNDLLLSNVVSKFYDFIVYNRPISIDVSDKDAVWLNSFCKYGKKDHEINRNLLGKTVETNGTRPTAIHVISLDVMHYISTCTIRWPSQIARFRFFLAGGFEALLIGATDNLKYKNNSNLRERCLSCLKNIQHLT